MLRSVTFCGVLHESKHKRKQTLAQDQQEFIFNPVKVTVYLQGCLSSKPLYQIKAYRTGYQTIPIRLKSLSNF